MIELSKLRIENVGVLQAVMTSLAEFAAAFLLHLVSAIICLTCFVHWIYIHYHNHNSNFFSRLGSQMITLQYLAIISYTMVPLVFLIEMIQQLIKHRIDVIENNFDVHSMYTIDNGAHNDHYTYTATSFYQAGKILNYIILFLRLKQMLKDSIFEYSKKVYTTMTCLIISLILIITTDYSVALFPYSEKIQIIFQLVTCLYINYMKSHLPIS